MFSSSQNIDRLVRLIEETRTWADLRQRYARLALVDKTTRLVTALALLVVGGTLLFAAWVFVCLAAACAVAPLLGSMAWAMACVAGGNVLLLLLVVLCRGWLLERPLIAFLSTILLSAPDETEG